MAKNQTQLGHVKRVSGFVSGVKAGNLVQADGGWAGVLVKDVVGTSESNVNPFGREPEGESGDGIGDIELVTVHKLVDEDYPGSPLALGAKVKMGAEAIVGPGITWASGVKSSAAPGDTKGHVWSIAGVEGGVRFVNVKLLGHPSTDT